MTNLKNSHHDLLKPVVFELGVTVYLCQQFETSLLFLVAMLSAQQGMIPPIHSKQKSAHTLRKRSVYWPRHSKQSFNCLKPTRLIYEKVLKQEIQSLTALCCEIPIGFYLPTAAPK